MRISFLDKASRRASSFDRACGSIFCPTCGPPRRELWHSEIVERLGELPSFYVARLDRSPNTAAAIRNSLARRRRRGEDAGYLLAPRTNGTYMLLANAPLAPRLARGVVVDGRHAEPFVRVALNDALARKPSASRGWQLGEPEDRPQPTGANLRLGVVPVEGEEAWWSAASEIAVERYGKPLVRSEPIPGDIPMEVVPDLFEEGKRQLRRGDGDT